MSALLLMLISIVACLPACAAPVPTPELDPGSLSAISAGLMGAYFAFRLYKSKAKQ